MSQSVIRPGNTYVVNNKPIPPEISVKDNLNFKKYFEKTNEYKPVEKEPNTISYERSTQVLIHSAERDKLRYPDPSEFKASLGQTFKNITKIELVSSSIPNTAQTITDVPQEIQNNLITWENEEDLEIGLYKNITISNNVSNTIDIHIPNHRLDLVKSNRETKHLRIFNSSSTPNIDGIHQVMIIDENTLRIEFFGGLTVPGTCSVDVGVYNYTINLTPGNYTTATIASKIQSSSNSIKRRNHTSDVFHYFNNSVDTSTDIIRFHNVIMKRLSSNAMGTQAGLNVISVFDKGHGYKDGDEVLFDGVKSISGISANLINTIQTITVIDFNNYSFEIADVANATGAGGGSTIKSGRKAPFRFLFNTAKSSIVKNIGFANEDSSVADTGIVLESITYDVEAFQILNSSKIKITTTQQHRLMDNTKLAITHIALHGSSCVITLAGNHNLKKDFKMFFYGTNTVPSIDGEYIVKKVGNNKIKIPIQLETINSFSGFVLFGGDRIKLTNIKTSPLDIKMPFLMVENSTNFTFECYVPFILSLTNNSLTGSVVETTQLIVNHPNHKFNEITNITYNAPWATITTLLPHNLNGKFSTGLNTSTTENDTVDINYTSHGLTTSDEIVVSNSTTNPNINGTYNVQRLNNNSIRINFTGGVSVAGTCDVFSGDTVIMTETNCVPSIDVNNIGVAKYNLHTLTPTTFRVNPGFNITSGNYGIIGRSNELVSYRTKTKEYTLGGVSLDLIDGRYRTIDKIYDEYSYMVRLHNIYFSSSETSLLNNTVISSACYGYNEYQYNTVDGTANTKLYRSINLAGEDFIFITVPGLKAMIFPYSRDTIITPLDDIFAMIILNTPPGTMIYDTYKSSPICYENPKQFLTELNLKVVRKDGVKYNFNDLDWFIILQITEKIYLVDT